MRATLAHHLLRYHPSKNLTVCQHIRLRFPQDSSLASDALLTPDNNFPSGALPEDPHPGSSGTAVGSSVEPSTWRTLGSLETKRAFPAGFGSPAHRSLALRCVYSVFSRPSTQEHGTQTPEPDC